MQPSQSTSNIYKLVTEADCNLQRKVIELNSYQLLIMSGSTIVAEIDPRGVDEVLPAIPNASSLLFHTGNIINRGFVYRRSPTVTEEVSQFSMGYIFSRLFLLLPLKFGIGFLYVTHKYMILANLQALFYKTEEHFFCGQGRFRFFLRGWPVSKLLSTKLIFRALANHYKTLMS